MCPESIKINKITPITERGYKMCYSWKNLRKYIIAFVMHIFYRINNCSKNREVDSTCQNLIQYLFIIFFKHRSFRFSKNIIEDVTTLS